MCRTKMTIWKIICIYNHIVNLGHGGLVQATPTIGGNKTNMFRVSADLSRWTSLNIYPMFILIPKQLWLVKRAKLWTKCCAAKVAIINLGVMNSVGNVALTGKGQYCQYCSLQMCMFFSFNSQNSRSNLYQKLKIQLLRGQKHLKWPCQALASDKLHFISLLFSKIKSTLHNVWNNMKYRLISIYHAFIYVLPCTGGIFFVINSWHPEATTKRWNLETGIVQRGS